MTEYWKSNAKKFCEICKVWYADNKASIEHHEMGAKHKAMVQKRLREMSKSASEKESNQGHLNATLIAMEQAALASMRQKGEYIPSTAAGPEVRAAPRPAVPKVDPKQEAKDRKRKIKELKKSSKQSQFWQEGEEDFIEWVQAEANGQTYYWNIFTQETEWEAPSLFYTTEEYTTNYETISQKINDLLKRAETQVEDEQTSASPEIAQPPVEEVQEKKSKRSSDFKSKSTSDPKKPSWFELNEQNNKDAAEFKKQVSSKRWDVRNMVSSDVVETVQNPEDSVETASKYVEKFVEPQPTTGLGPWIPIKPEALSTTELQKQDKQKIVLDDLPEQETKKTDPIFDEDEHDAETNFTDKKLPVATSKKSKPVMFRKTKSKSTASVKQEQ